MDKIRIEELKSKSIWVCWQGETVDGRVTKVPKNPHTTGNARTNDPSTWGTYYEAELAMRNNRYSGLGFVFTDGLCGIDIDSHVNINNKYASEILSMFRNTYIELSPSKTGYHIICLCDTKRLPIERDENGEPIVGSNGKYKLSKYYLKNGDLEVEIYPSGITSRFFTFTGNTVNNCDILDMTDTVNIFLNKYMVKKTALSPTLSIDSMEEVIDKARNATNGKNFKRLFDNGDISDYNFDHSRADLALCSMLAYWFDSNDILIDEAFRKSALCRDKWINREDYRMSTIANAKNNVIRPTVDYNAVESDKKQRITLDSLTSWLEANDFSVRENEVTHEIEIKGIKIPLSNSIDNQLAYMFDLLKEDFRVSLEEFTRLVKIIADLNRINPIKEMLYNLPPWDGINRLPILYNIMKVADEDTLSKTLIHKWLLMTMALSENRESEPFGADGILVIQGAQGIGKTSLCSKLGMNSSLFKAGQYINTKDKDTIIRVTSCWIAELGEIAYTFKSDTDKLKAFFTQEIDSFRVPYGRADSKHIRHTSFIATTNDEQFLLDPTGSRRFWTVPLEDKFDLRALSEFDMGQLWKQIENELHQNPYSNAQGSAYQQSFRLNEEERIELSIRNAPLNKMVKAQAEVQDILDKAELDTSKYDWKYASVTEWKANYISLSKYSAEQVGRALDAVGIRQERTKIGGKVQRTRFLPMYKYMDDPFK